MPCALAKDPLFDDGIVAQTIILGAVDKGLGGCIIVSIQRQRLGRELEISEHCTIRLVIALGKPSEEVVFEDLEPGGDIRYWRDEKDVHHVPKRSVDELIMK